MDTADISKIIDMHLKPKQSFVLEKPLEHHWQVDLEQYLVSTNPSKRRIRWYIDPEGNTGKTFFIKYFYSLHPMETLVFTQFGGQKDTATIVEKAMNRGIVPRYILVDLPRSMESKSIYEPLECLKNGMLTATKYEGEFSIFDNPHLIVMANFEPDLITLSMDRWEVFYLDKFGWGAANKSAMLERQKLAKDALLNKDMQKYSGILSWNTKHKKFM